MSSDPTPAWRAIIASSLDWQEAHASFASVVAGLPAALRGRRPAACPHSAWELVEHIRRTQVDLADFMENPDYQAPTWPDEYWPPSPEPPSPEAWDAAIAAVGRDGDRLKAIARRDAVDLAQRIPWCEGQTYLRTLLVALDHTSHHVGQLILVRRLLGAWPPG